MVDITRTLYPFDQLRIVSAKQLPQILNLLKIQTSYFLNFDRLVVFCILVCFSEFTRRIYLIEQ